MNLDGSNRRQLTDNDRQEFLPHFSPDGTRLIYTMFTAGAYGQPDSASDVGLYDFARRAETNLTKTGKDSYPVWSPDGSRIAFLSLRAGDLPGPRLWIMNADGSQPHEIAGPSGAADDKVWGDIAWSSRDWILFVVAQTIDGCFKTRLDKIRPDGSDRTRVTDGGPNCTPTGMEQSGDADPGFSADGLTVYSSRGFPRPPAGATFPMTERRLFAFSSEAWVSGKPETDLGLRSEPSCVEGVPKGSADGVRILLFRACFADPHALRGIYLTDSLGTYRTWIADGFGPDWNPAR
jgi:Tol biopolymer transport system component